MLHLQIPESTFSVDRISLLRHFIQLCRDQVHGTLGHECLSGAPSMEDAQLIETLSGQEHKILESAPGLPFRLHGLSDGLKRLRAHKSEGGCSVRAPAQPLGQAGVLILTSLMVLKSVARVDLAGARLMFGLSREEVVGMLDCSPNDHATLASSITLMLTPAFRVNAAILRLRDRSDKPTVDAQLAVLSAMVSTMTLSES